MAPTIPQLELGKRCGDCPDVKTDAAAPTPYSLERVSTWDRVAADWLRLNPHPAWRRHSDRINAALISRWLPCKTDGRLLKTDLFDEAVGDGLYAAVPSA